MVEYYRKEYATAEKGDILMKKFIKKGAVLIAAALLLTGCGEEMAVLTESEEMIVVNYSAGTLAKHNSYQQEGISGVYPKEEEEEPVLEDEEQEEKEKEDTEGGESQGGDQKGEEESSGATFTEALAIPGIEFSYKDYSISDNYQQGGYFSLDAQEGNTYVILNVNMTNTGSEAVSCDLLSKQPIFNLKINEEAGVKNEITMLENDLSTYIGTLEPGQTAAGILLFEVPQASAENISNIHLTMQMNESTTEIKLK